MLIARKEAWLFVSERLDAATAERLRKGMLELQASGVLARILAQPREDGGGPD